VDNEGDNDELYFKEGKISLTLPPYYEYVRGKTFFYIYIHFVLEKERKL